MKAKLSSIFICFFLLVFSFSYSQIDDLGGDLPPTDDPEPPAAPIDSLIYLLMFLGVFYVFRLFVLKLKKQNY